MGISRLHVALLTALLEKTMAIIRVHMALLTAVLGARVGIIPIRDKSIRLITMNSFQLSIFNRGIVIESDGAKVQRVIALIYESLRGESRLDLRYSVTHKKGSRVFTLRRNPQESITASNDGELVFLLENDMTVELQKLRSDLYFIHAAALEFRERAILLVGPSGSGKSTTTWGLLHFGFRYLSDELAPVRLDRMEVVPYPRALCLKTTPPGGYPLPNGILQTSHTLHVPVKCMPSDAISKPTKVGVIFFLRDFSSPAVGPMRKADAATRLFMNALNPLAHTADGLDAAIDLVENNICFELFAGEISATCSLIKTTLNSLPI